MTTLQYKSILDKLENEFPSAFINTIEDEPNFNIKDALIEHLKTCDKNKEKDILCYILYFIEDIFKTEFKYIKNKDNNCFKFSDDVYKLRICVGDWEENGDGSLLSFFGWMDNINDGYHEEADEEAGDNKYYYIYIHINHPLIREFYLNDGRGEVINLLTLTKQHLQQIRATLENRVIANAVAEIDESERHLFHEPLRRILDLIHMSETEIDILTH
jgi:hypothetical protein